MFKNELKTFFYNLPVPSLIIDIKTGIIKDANEKSVKFYGYSKEEFKNMPVAVINPFVPIEEATNLRIKAFKSGYSFAVFRHKLKNGETKDVEVNISAIPDNGTPYIQAVIQDVTEKIKAEKRLHRLLDFNAALAQINQIIMENNPETEMLKSICVTAVKCAHLKVAYIGRPDNEGMFRFLAYSGEVDFLKGVLVSINPDIPEGRGMLGTAWREKKIQYSNSFLKSSNLLAWKELAERFGVGSVAAMPIYRAGKIWGVFAVYHGEENIFDEDLIALMEETAKDISLGLDRIDSSTNQDELLSTQKALLGNTVAGIIVTDRDRRLIIVNNRTVEMFGCESETELLGQNSRILYPNDEEYKSAGETYKSVSEPGKTPKKWIFNFQRKDGTPFWAEISASLAYIKGIPVTVWTFYDITEKKILEDKLKESEELFRTLTDNLPVSIGMHKNKYIYVNPQFINMFGYSAQELKDMDAWEVDAEEYRKGAQERICRGLIDINDKYDIIVQGVKKSGERLWMHIYANSVKYKGEIVRIASFVDITESFVLKNDLEQERDLLKVFIENIHSGIALYNKNKFIYVNLALLDLFDYSEEDFLNLRPNIFFSIGEEQIYRMSPPVFKKHHNNELSSRIIYKYVKDGIVRYIDLFRTAIKYGNEETGLAIFSDVTDQILKEQNILVEKETYKELSEHDVLTGINNRRSFDDRFTELINVALRYGRPLSLIMFDIDHFKNINDTYGHETGDFVLKELSAVVKEALRTTDFFARYGGEEFMIIAQETPIATAKELAERLRFKTENHRFAVERSITCSFGLTEAKEGDTYEDIMHRVDAALYEAKGAGRNKVCVKTEL